MQQKDIYIVLTGTGTLFSQTIKWFTKAPLNHTSISFNSELSEVYSFGRKRVNNPFIGGLIHEDFHDPFYNQADCAVYRYHVDIHDYMHIYSHVSQMMNNRDQYKYHLLGLLGVLLNRNFNRENAFFCSHFVANLLEKTSDYPLNKPSHFVTPGDFEASLSTREIYRGKVADYLNASRQSLTA